MVCVGDEPLMFTVSSLCPGVLVIAVVTYTVSIIEPGVVGSALSFALIGGAVLSNITEVSSTDDILSPWKVTALLSETLKNAGVAVMEAALSDFGTGKSHSTRYSPISPGFSWPSS